jgi:Glycosyl hydrolase family 47
MRAAVGDICRHVQHSRWYARSGIASGDHRNTQVDIRCAPAGSGAPYHKMDHLACFTPGMLALGAKYGAVTGAKAEQYMQLGRNLTETCYQMYARQPTGAATPSSTACAC